MITYDEIDRLILDARRQSKIRENSQFKYMVRMYFTWEWYEFEGTMYVDDIEGEYALFKTEKEARAYFDKAVSTEKYPVGPENPLNADLLKVEYDQIKDDYDELDIIDSK